jgi:hypothetical protein
MTTSDESGLELGHGTVCFKFELEEDRGQDSLHALVGGQT